MPPARLARTPEKRKISRRFGVHMGNPGLVVTRQERFEYSSMSSPAVKSTGCKKRQLHPLPLRIMHWINALAIFIMIGSGMRIYNDSPLFGWLRFPALISLGGDPDVSVRFHSNGGQSGALQWHFL